MKKLLGLLIYSALLFFCGDNEKTAGVSAYMDRVLINAALAK